MRWLPALAALAACAPIAPPGALPSGCGPSHPCSPADTVGAVGASAEPARGEDAVDEERAARSDRATARQTLESNPSKYKASGDGGLRLQSIVCGGSAPPPEMMSWYKREYGVQFTQGWGMTETSPMGSNGKALSKFKHVGWGAEQQFANGNFDNK